MTARTPWPWKSAISTARPLAPRASRRGHPHQRSKPCRATLMPFPVREVSLIFASARSVHLLRPSHANSSGRPRLRSFAAAHLRILRLAFWSVCCGYRQAFQPFLEKLLPEQPEHLLSTRFKFKSFFEFRVCDAQYYNGLPPALERLPQLTCNHNFGSSVRAVFTNNRLKPTNALCLSYLLNCSAAPSGCQRSPPTPWRLPLCRIARQDAHIFPAEIVP